MPSITLKPGRENSLKRRHPWVFSGAVARVQGNPSSGETVEILSSRGDWLAAGSYSPQSQIRVRAWTFEREEKIDAAFFLHRLKRSVEFRDSLLLREETTAYRLVNAESDGLPGIVVDRYADFLVCQFLSAGAEFWREAIGERLRECFPEAGIFERSDTDARRKEGLEPRAGGLAGPELPEWVEVREGPLRFLVDVRRGHKTGAYLDQRENRRLVGDYSQGADVLNCFSYTGGFGLWALHGGAKSVVNVETSAEAQETARKNLELNGLDESLVEAREEDVFQLLRKFRDEGRSFDLIVLDPPKFAESADQVPGACRGYKDINLLAFKLLRPGGLLFTFSCSGHIEMPLFQKVVADAALDAGREGRIIRPLSQSPDHAVALQFPEGVYLKGLFCRAL